MRELAVDWAEKRRAAGLVAPKPLTRATSRSLPRESAKKPKKLSYHDIAPEKEREMIQRCQGGDRQAGDFLWRACEGLVRRDFAGYMKRLGDDDVLQASILGILTAIRRFDLSRDVRLYTYARYYVIRELSELADQVRGEESLYEPMGDGDEDYTLLDSLAMRGMNPEEAAILAQEIRLSRM